MSAGPEHVIVASADGDSVHLDLRLVVAPRDGRFHPVPPDVVTAEGEVVHTGDVIGHVVRATEREPVRAFCTGFLMGLLADADDQVRAGQPLAWIHPVHPVHVQPVHPVHPVAP